MGWSRRRRRTTHPNTVWTRDHIVRSLLQSLCCNQIKLLLLPFIIPTFPCQPRIFPHVKQSSHHSVFIQNKKTYNRITQSIIRRQRLTSAVRQTALWILKRSVELLDQTSSHQLTGNSSLPPPGPALHLVSYQEPQPLREISSS